MKLEYPKSLDEFLKFFNKYNNNGNNYYRGQADYSWDITPSLARNKGFKNIYSLLEVESKLIAKFRQIIIENNLSILIPNVNGYDDYWIILMAGQHYGLPTRFLDFTHDKFVALTFAAADINYLNKDGAIIIYENPDDNQKDISILRSSLNINFRESFFLQAPKFANKKNNEYRLSETRKVLQGSKFFYRSSENLYNCLSLDPNHTERLIKIHIPYDIKLDIIRYIIDKGEMVYDLFAGKNELDYFAAILKLEFSRLTSIKIVEYLKNT